MKTESKRCEPHVLTIVCAEPARRHRCEVCRKIFICHLCTIAYTSAVHRIDGIPEYGGPATSVDAETPLLVCPDCMETDGYRYLYNQTGIRDYRTGKVIQRGYMAHRMEWHGSLPGR